MRRRFAGFREGDSIESSLMYTSRYFSRYERAGILVETPFRKAKSIFELSRENVFALVSRCLYLGGEFNYPRREEVFMSLQALYGEPSVDERIRKVVCLAHSVGIQRFQCFARLLFYSIYDYVCCAIRQCKALSFLGQVDPHRIKRSIRMWIPDAERLRMSAAEVEGGEGHLSCVKNALMNHERALYHERLACYDAMLAAHEEK